MGDLNLRTTSVNSINKLMVRHDNGELDALELAMKQVTLDNLDSHYNRFIKRHMELVAVASKSDEVEEHQLLFDAVEEKYSKIKAKLASAIEKEVAAEIEGSVHESVHAVPAPRHNGNDMRLEKVVLPEFHGEFNKWIGFRDMFESLIHKQEQLSTAAKYARLMKALKGAAAAVVAGFLPTDAKYDSAWETLKARYDNKRVIVTTHLNIFLGLESLEKEKETNVRLRRFVGISNETTRSLAAIKLPVEHWDDMLVHILVLKLPKATVISWELELQQKGVELPKLKALLDFLEGRARGLDHMGLTQAERPSQSNSTGGKRTPATAAHASPANTSNTGNVNVRTNCSKCRGGHFLGRCPVVEALPANERFAAIKDLKVCYNCFYPGHSTRDCKSESRCRKCQGKHHTILCRTGGPNQAKAASTTTTGGSTAPSPPTTA